MKHDNQTIHCNVTSCAYNEKAQYCSLQSIHVNPCSNCCGGTAAEETLCGSYQAK